MKGFKVQSESKQETSETKTENSYFYCTVSGIMKVHHVQWTFNEENKTCSQILEVALDLLPHSKRHFQLEKQE